ncbi:sigma-70 family RNA polymerase sigma factor [Actinoplanes sp. TBRC 11911]|uniref:sigma-70 family RNA polymerase sigma factor n=1 Tax=Actinoplanes sp. TBRC 11911 TaxID=2729386 RepID=UPI00145E9694|nr:sigma-70 family RNA polymerase sigma factor [Actinoplanes sp. TBRC 11911]NMO55976.1 sigma-70 family RNA polymerase sigma factor [Actinoplanes sp. TBRC 11911]
MAFEDARPRLVAMAHRMLGSATEAEDAVQEAWLRYNRVDGADIQNEDAWLTTVVGRICLDMLRSRSSRREEEFTVEPSSPAAGPEQQALLADSVGVALVVVLETLSPAERLAFVLHDLFAVSFDEIAPILDRSPEATRQLASRARRRVRQTPAAEGRADRRIVDAFLTAARGGELETLVTLLDPEVSIRVDGRAQEGGSDRVAHFFSGRAQAARPALVDGQVGVLVAVAGETKAILRVSIDHEQITQIEAITDPAVLATIAVVPLP